MAITLKPLTEDDQRALEKRGISAETAAKLGWQTCAGRKGWIGIPFYRKGKIVNRKFRRIVKDPEANNFEQDKGGEQCFYNLEALEAIGALKPEDQRGQQIVITEGEMDCAIALQCGYLAVSVPAGAPGKSIDDEDSAKYEFLKDFPKYAVAVLAVDDDPAGHAMRQDLALRLGWHRCKWVKYPKDKLTPEAGTCKDLNRVFEVYGQKGIDAVLKDNPKFMNEGGLFRMNEIAEQPELEAFDCGIGNVSSMIKIRPGDMLVFTGISSMGKSLFVNCLAANFAKDLGWNVCVASFEASPRTDYQRYLRTYYLDKPQYGAGGYPNWSEAEIAMADAWINKYYSFIVPDLESDELATLKWILARCRAAITQYGARIVIIDPWNELDHDRPNGMTLTEYTGYAIKEFKRLAKQYMVTVIIVAHPSKPEKNKMGTYGIPTLYDISDSAHWYNKCDIGVVIHRIDGEAEGSYGTLVRVAKVRHWNIIGRVGDRMLEYLPERGKYIDNPEFRPKRTGKPDDKKTEKKSKAEDKTPEQPVLGLGDND